MFWFAFYIRMNHEWVPQYLATKVWSQIHSKCTPFSLSCQQAMYSYVYTKRLVPKTRSWNDGQLHFSYSSVHDAAARMSFKVPLLFKGRMNECEYYKAYLLSIATLNTMLPLTSTDQLEHVSVLWIRIRTLAQKCWRFKENQIKLYRVCTGIIAATF